MLGAVGEKREIHDPRLTVRAWMVHWLDSRTDIRESTRRLWSTCTDRLLREIGTLRLIELGPSDVEAALATMKPGIATNAATVLSGALKAAMREGIVTRNVAALAVKPKVKRRVRHVPDAAECRALIAAAPKHPLGALAVTALGTGMRQGELCGLMRDALDLEAATLNVEWQLARGRGGRYFSRPKTDTSKRLINLPPFVVKALRTHLAEQAKAQIAAGPKWRDADRLVFTAPSGRSVSDTRARETLDELCAIAGVERCHFHALRSAALTLVTEAEGLKAAQGLAGHTNSATTDGYARQTDPLRERAAHALQEAMG